jgi:4-amino-4-deoxy-L-arabinose transferase-like glycosyltransferase
MSIRTGWQRVNPAVLAYFFLLLALALRLAYWRNQWNAPLAIVGDEGNYYGGGLMLARGSAGFWTSDDWLVWQNIWLLPPLYQVALGGLIRLLGEHLLPLRLFQTLIGTFTIALAYRIGRSLFDRQVGLGAALLVALWRPFVHLPVLLMTENLFIPLLLSAMLCLVESARSLSAFAAKASSREGLSVLRTPVWLFAAGVLLALATLTRSVTTLFFLVIPLWLIYLYHFRWRAAVLPVVAFLLGAALLFVPWGLRNYGLYDRLLLTDTMGGRNFNAANGGISEAQLALIPNPVDRQAVAVRAGLAHLLANPADLVGRIVPNASHILRLEETGRLLGNLDDGLDSHAAAGLLFDDGIWLVVVLCAIVGLSWTREWRTGSLLLLFIGYTFVLLVIVFFASVRYRWPLLPLLAPYAAYGLRVAWTRRLSSFPAWRVALALSLCALALALIGWGYPARIGQVTAREVALANASTDMRAGQWQLAARELQVAQQIDPDSLRVQLAWGDLYRGSGDFAQAIAAYRQAWELQGDSLPAQIRLGDAYRATGQNDLAAALLEAQGDDDGRLLDWAWEHPEAVSGSPSRLDVGRLDAGFVRGMLPAERIVDENGEWTYRWTRGTAQVRLFPPAMGAQVLSMRLNAFRTEGIAQPHLSVVVNGRALARFVVRRIWWVYNLKLPAELAKQSPLVVTLLSDVWIPGGQGEDVPATYYGVEVNWVEVGPASIQQ